MPHCNCSENMFYYYGLSSIIDEIENDSIWSGKVLFVCAIDVYDLMAIKSCITSNIKSRTEHVVIVTDIFKKNVFFPFINVSFAPSSIDIEDVENIINGKYPLCYEYYNFSLSKKQRVLAFHYKQNGNVLKSSLKYKIKTRSLYYHKYSMMLSLGVSNNHDLFKFISDNNLEELF